MGICSSCESTAVATAKLILVDGKLQEFSYPVKVAYLLSKYPTCFICNSDEMEFDDVLSAVDDNDELQLGQIYFALPLSRLKRRLQPEEMAALAVKASSALMKCNSGGSGGCRRNSYSPAPDVKSSPKAVTGGRRQRNRLTSAGQREFAAMLSAIPE